MTPFLKTVADDVYKRFNGRLENIAVVFPNKRAGLFFNKYLLENSGDVPMWSPRYMTISELFQQNSELAVGDPILLVSKLYKEYVRPRRGDESLQEYERNVETLDSFYYWGEMLIRDFDDIDKNLADAKQLFSNIKELREMGTGKDTLEPEQQKSIEQFFKNFKPEENSDIKRNFKELWERLYAIYTNFKESLRRDNIAYEGMLYRDVIENIGNMKLDCEKYIFVGFNALNGAETKLFSMLEKSGKALFYWDYDRYYIEKIYHEAGHFMRKNLERFPNALKGCKTDNLNEKKNVTVVSASSDSIQARYLSQWLGNNLTDKEIETAVVLCDETMLEPALHTIPETANGNELKYLNVTMGYPISHTPVYSFVKQLVELQLRGWSEKHGAFSLMHVSNVLKHPYVIMGSENSTILRETLLKEKRFYPTEEELHADEFLSRVFTRYTNNKEWIESIAGLVYDIARISSKNGEEKHELYSMLFSEAILKVHTQAQRLIRLFESGELTLQQPAAGNLFVRMLSMQSMPFHGEPVVGLQVMGLLETRNLDFRNVIMLSVNEGNIPKAGSENSYIPYNLRRAFGLTLSEHRDSIYAYNFYRLLQRAENVTLVYNNSTDSKSRGECSRYILQLLGSGLYDIKRLALSAEQGSQSIVQGSVEKDSAVIDILRRRFDTGYSDEAKTMTPSAVNRYLKCGLNFFYYYVLGLKPLEDIDTEITPSDFGVIFHKAAQMFYEKLSANGNNPVQPGSFDYYIKNPALLYRFIDDAFQEEFFKGNKPVYNGEQYINRGMLHHFLLHLIKMDKEYAPFYYVCGEEKISMPMSIESEAGTISLEIGGTIDRVDVKNGTVNIVDYKTGGGGKDAKSSLEEIFALEGKSSGYRLQSFLYSIVLDDLLKGRCCRNTKIAQSWAEKLKPLNTGKVSPSLLYVHKEEELKREDYVVDIKGEPVTDISEIREEYVEKLLGVLSDIFDRDVPFTPTDDKKRCEYCDYRKICGK